LQDKGNIDVNKKAKSIVTKDDSNLVMTEIITLMGNEQEIKKMEDGVQNLPPKPSLSVEKNLCKLKGKKKVGKPKALSFNSSYGSDSSGPSVLDNTKEMLPKKIHFQEGGKKKEEKNPLEQVEIFCSLVMG
jgi:hypothetical protein